MSLFKSYISYYVQNHPLKICPKRISLFTLKFTPFSSNNIISIAFSHANWKTLIISNTPLYPSPILSPKSPVLPLKSISNVLIPFYSQSLCPSLGPITSHYEAA